MDNVKKISEEIKKSIAPAIEDWEEKFFQSVRKLQRYCDVTVYEEAEKENRRRDYVYIRFLRTKKGWSPSIQRFFGRSESDLREMIKKEAKKKLQKIDVAVAKKLKDVNVESIEMLSFTTNSPNRFCEGCWEINGDKKFSFYAVYAGGYNIQTLHVRTLYSFK